MQVPAEWLSIFPAVLLDDASMHLASPETGNEINQMGI